MKRRTVIAGIALSLVIGSTAHAGISFQAPGLQGISFQGISFQGISFQGISFQGISFQGISFQGISFQGVGLDGSELDMWGVGYDGRRRVLQHRGYNYVHEWELINGQWVSQGNKRGTQVGATFPVELTDDTGAVHTYTARIAGAMPAQSTNSMTFYKNGEFSDNSDVILYKVEILFPNGDGTDVPINVCHAGNDWGLFLDGTWGADGEYNPAGMTFACDGTSGGVLAKCVTQWGYKPWLDLEVDDGSGVMQSLAPFHRACVRAARADYCGSGYSFTKNGTPIDVFDTYGFNVWASYSEELAFEEAYYCGDDATFVMESVFDDSGTLFHHEERYSHVNLDLYCPGGYPENSQYTSDEWDLWGFFGDHIHNTPLIAVRSIPTITWEFGPPLIEWEEPTYPLDDFGDQCN